MKKSLLLAALLLSSAAHAETFICTNTVGVSISGTGIINPMITGRTWIADTRRGMRTPSAIRASEEYSGECEVRNVGNRLKANISCRIIEHTTDSIVINKISESEIVFTASDLSTLGAIFAGTCVEL